MKKNIIFLAIICGLFIIINSELKSVCPNEEGWGIAQDTTYVKNSNNEWCEIIIHYCVRLRTEGGQNYLDMVYDYFEYTTPSCGYYVVHDATFWGIVNESVWDQLLNTYYTIFQPCSTQTYTIVKTELSTCLKIVNYPIQQVC